MTSAAGSVIFDLVFLNISNHPAAQWPDKQREAAERLGGAIVDEPFPEVPPETSSQQTADLGAKLLRKVLALGPTAAMVQGEFVLSFYLVLALEARKIPCYAATTRRVVEVATLGDGATRRVSRFEFVQFRRYHDPVSGRG